MLMISVVIFTAMMMIKTSATMSNIRSILGDSAGNVIAFVSAEL
jgi:hypothetical protein